MERGDRDHPPRVVTVFFLAGNYCRYVVSAINSRSKTVPIEVAFCKGCFAVEGMFAGVSEIKCVSCGRLDFSFDV